MRAETSLLGHFVLPLAVLLGFAGCATIRPDPGLTCNLHVSSQDQSLSAFPAPPPGEQQIVRSLPLWDHGVPQAASDLRKQIAQNFKDRTELKRAIRPGEPSPVPPGARPSPAPVPAPSYDVLVLSAGGQFGAYGSGFLKGWGDRADLSPNRADIDMITGVSTGAMMASYAYLGSSNDPVVRAKYDALLKDQYTTLRNEDVFRARSPVEFLYANSIFDSAPLRARIMGLITEELLDAVIAEEQSSKRLLFVGAVNADSGQFEYFDLIAIAKDRSHDRRACYAAAILASAAIPIAFNPVFINGSMYLDGGARQHAFFLAQVAAALPQATKNVFGILHGDLMVPRQTTKNNLIGVVSRTSAIATDQLMLDSAYFVDAEGKRLGYSVRWTAATGTNCPATGSDDMFSPVVGSCLWENGLARARDDPNPWKELSDLSTP